MPSQDDNRLRRLLFVCLENRSRSPTAEWEARIAGFDADSAGTEPSAVVHLRDDHLQWADLVICMDSLVADKLDGPLNRFGHFVPVICWGIADDFNTGDPALIKLIRARLRTLQPLKHMIPDTPVAMHGNPRASGVAGEPTT